MSSATSPGLPAGVQVNFHTAPLVFLTGTSCRLTRLYPGNLFSATLWFSMLVAAPSMSVVFCGVRSTSTSMSPGPVKSVARALRFSLQPGGRSSENPATAGAPRSAAVTFAFCQPDGSTADGLFSASTDLKPVAVSWTNPLLPDCVAPGETPPPLCWVRASATPTAPPRRAPPPLALVQRARPADADRGGDDDAPHQPDDLPPPATAAPGAAAA